MRTLADVRQNHTDVELTEENIQPTALAVELDLPFIEARCHHCNANLCLNDGVVTCLNACYLSVGAHRKMQAGLMAAQRRIDHR